MRFPILREKAEIISEMSGCMDQASGNDLRAFINGRGKF
jgi:hypothetical protein